MNIASFFSQSVLTWIIIPLLIFIARILDVSIGTIRIIFVAKGMKYLAPVLGFFEVLIWLLAIRQIMQNLNNPIHFIAYACGFATGNYVGMLIEHKLAMGVALIRIITKKEAAKLVNRLRENGYIVTDVNAEGNRGPVRIIFTVIKRKEIKRFVDLLRRFYPKAFYTIEDVVFVSDYTLPKLKKEKKLSRLHILKKK